MIIFINNKIKIGEENKFLEQRYVPSHKSIMRRKSIIHNLPGAHEQFKTGVNVIAEMFS